MRELAYKKLQAAKEKAVNQDDVQIIEGMDEKDGSNASIENKASTDNKEKSVDHKDQHAILSGEGTAKSGVDVVDIPVPMSDDSNLAGKTPPLPASQPVLPPAPITAANLTPNMIVHTSPTTSSAVANNCPIAVSHSPNFPAHTSVQQPPPPPPLPQLESASTVLPPVSVPMPAVSVPIPPAPVLPNMSVPPPPIPIPVPAPNTIMSKFNAPNNLVPLKSVDPPKPPIVAFKTKSLSRLPLPPGINQNDLESIDSPPSRSPSPPNKTQVKFPTSTSKPPQKKSFKDLPMPPGRCYFSICFTVYMLDNVNIIISIDCLNCSCTWIGRFERRGRPKRDTTPLETGTNGTETEIEEAKNTEATWFAKLSHSHINLRWQGLG